MNFTIQRFAPGHKFYTLITLSHEGKDYQCVFGQCLDEQGHFLHYTLERKDTLIAEGKYSYDLTYSPANKTIVPRLVTDPHDHDISTRMLEHHIANFPYELKGCCAHGKGIDVTKGMLTGSGIAFHELMALVEEDKGGYITYETLKQMP